MQTQDTNHEMDLKRPSRILFWVLQFFAMIPIIVTKNLPFSDYSNHLARVVTLTRDGGSELFPTFYHPNLSYRPYLGFDLPTWLLSHLFSFEIAGKLVVIGALTLWNFGLFRLAERKHGIGLAGCLPILLTYNMMTIQGFMPYLVGLSLIPWYLIAFQSKPASIRVLPALILFPVVIFSSHQLALLVSILGGFCFLFDLDSDMKQRKIQIAQLATLLALNLVYFKLAKFGGNNSSIEFGGISRKIHNLTEAFLTGSLKFDLAYVAACLVFVGVLVMRKQFALSRLVLAFFVICFGLFLVFPNKLGLAENIDYRFILFGLSFGFALLIPRSLEPKTFRAIAAVTGIFVLARSAMVTKNFHVSDVRLAEARQAFKSLEGTPAILVGTVGEHSQWESSQWKPMSYSVAPYAAIDRPAYVNTLFQEPSMMTIAHGDVQRAFDYVGRLNGKAVAQSPMILAEEADKKIRALPVTIPQGVKFYLLVVSTDLEPLPSMPTEVFHGSYFSIYSLPTEPKFKLAR